MLRTIPETIQYFKLLKEQCSQQGKNSFIIETQIIDPDYNVQEYLESYYNNQQTGCTIKYCVLRNSYEVHIWW